MVSDPEGLTPFDCASFHRDPDALRRLEAVVAGPFQVDGAGLGRHRVEREIRVGGNGRIEPGPEHLLAVVGGGEVRDDVARHRLARLGVAEARFHDVGDERLDLDYGSTRRLGRSVDEGAGHQRTSSRQALTVTMTAARPDQNVPSDISATASTVWLSRSRMRVEMLAKPARGPSATLIT